MEAAVAMADKQLDLFGNKPWTTEPPDLFVNENGDDAAPIERHASQAYLGYAVSTVKSRALPDIADGLKPVQRRILYAMGEAGGANAAITYVKCARYVGEVLGKYHPHGDSSTYEAMVHLAQPFSMRYPLIDGQGNFGSRDGDSAAAYRYTEARLSRFAELMLSEIDEGTVDFIKNYDGKFDEPQLLPARLPFGLLNGSFGIPVGFSTRIPVAQPEGSRRGRRARHQASESHGEGGPGDPAGARFPGRRADHLGARRDPHRLRDRPRLDRDARALDHRAARARPVAHRRHRAAARRVRAARCWRRSRRWSIPKPSTGKKEMSQEQRRLKQFMLEQIETVRDESDRKSKLRLVIEPRSSRQSAEETMKTLLVHTSLETRYALNLTWLGLDGLPETKDIVTHPARVGRIPPEDGPPPHPAPPRPVHGAAAKS